MKLEDILEPLAELLAAKVAAKLAAPPSVYTTNAKGPGIPGKSRSWALRNIRTMPGSRKVGRDWQIGADAYEAWLAAKDESGVLPTSDVDALVSQGLAEAGYRRAR